MKYTILEKLTALREKLSVRKAGTRLLALLLALVLLQGDFMLSAYSAGEDSGETTEQSTVTENTTVPTAPEQAEAEPEVELPVDEDTLVITLDGAETTAVSLLPYEKVELKAEGLESDAEYQWQIRHPETGAWINIYDATEQCISVSTALVKNMLNKDGTAALRCYAHAEKADYVTSFVTITTVEESVAPVTLASSSAFTTSGGAVTLANDVEFVSVTIEYKLYGNVKQTDGTYKLQYINEAFSPYVARLKAGTTDEPTEYIDVASPTIVGYQPFWTKTVEGETVTNKDPNTPGAVITIPLTNVTQNITYTVEYCPAEVPYEVHYFFQNIYDDLYVEDTSLATPVFAQGETGLEPNSAHTECEFAGFTSLYYEPETIAADGSTVFQVYYERNYYLMEFDCAGGHGTDTIYVRYGTYISVPNPVRMGYVFAGWNPGTIIENTDGTATITYPTVADPETFVGVTLPSTMPHENTIYQAVWKHIATSYTVVYWYENANPETDGTYEYSYWGSETRGLDNYGTPDDTVISGDAVTAATFSAVPSFTGSEYATYNEAKTLEAQNKRDDLDGDGNVIVEGDGSTILNVYFSRATYTLKFYYAMSSGSENNTKYYVIGGSTHYFGTAASTNIDRNDDVALLDQYISSQSTHRGEVDEMPTLNATGHARNYTLGSVSSTVNNTAYNYHYISFKAKYGANISELWPCGVFNSVTRTSSNTHGNWTGTEAFVSAWNGEYNVEYTLNTTLNNGNQTIKGKFAQLNDALLWRDMSKNTDNTVSFLCFWENGANINWSVPELYRYNIYLECVDGVDYTGKTTIKRTVSYTDEANNTVTITADFYLADRYDTCDDSNGDQQTQPSITGYNSALPKDIDGDYDNANAGFTTYECHQITTFDTSLYKEAYDVNFFYAAKSGLELKFSNYNSDTNNKTVTFATSQMKFSQPLSSASGLSGETDPYIPGYPHGIEPNAYEFLGWYTTSLFLDGTRVDWTSDTMPETNQTLYARWEPIVRKVYFHLLYTDIAIDKTWDTTDKDGNPVTYPIEAPHGTLLGTTYNYLPTRDGYDFIGWFYMDEDNKKKFAPDSMEIKRDLHLFAEWHSTTDTEYEVKYTLAEEETIGGSTYPIGTQVGDMTTGHSSAGKTKTFTAKSRSELNLPFSEDNSKLYPTLNSHSILMSNVKDENKFSFTYIVDEEVWYKIRYLNKLDNSELADDEVYSNKDTNADIITAKFKPIEGYLPEKYYIRKVLAADGDSGSATNVSPQNEIIFYYIPDEEHGLYTIEYYLEKVDSTDSKNRDNYELARSIVAHADLMTGDNPTEIMAEILTFTGFEHAAAGDLFLDTVTTYAKSDDTYVPNPPVAGNSGQLSIGGLEIRVYYQRKSYPYAIKFVEYGNVSNILGYGLAGRTNVYPTAQTDYAKFESSFSYSAPDQIQKTVDGNTLTYLFHKTDDKTQTQTLQIRATDNTDTGNVLTFYYEVKKVTIQYEAQCAVVGATGFGEVSMNRESAALAANLAGANAMPGAGFEFMGWYNKETGNKVADDWVTGPDANGYYKLKPQDFGGDSNDDGVITYYALFAPITTNLTITKTVTGDLPAGMANDDTFLFHVKGQGKHEYLELTVAVTVNTGTGSVTIVGIPLDEYQVTELTAWSWEYAVSGESVKTIVLETDPSKNVVPFTNTYANPDWLGGESAVTDNIFN